MFSTDNTQRSRYFEAEITASTSTVKQRTSSNNNLSRIEEILVKQGRQIRVLYDLQKSTLDKISTVQNQMKKLTSINAELSSKVFNVSNRNLV